MKILILNANLQGIGTYNRCLGFGRALARHGHDVTIFTVSRDHVFTRETMRDDHLTITCEPNWLYKALPGWGAGPLDITDRIRQILKDRPDIVYGFEYQPNVSLPLYLTHWLGHYRFISDWCDWHSGASNHLRGIRLAHRVDAFFEERIRFGASAVTVISDTLRDRAISIGIPEERVFLVEEGVDTSYIHPMPQEEMRTKFGLPVEPPIVGIISESEEVMARAVQIFAEVSKRVPGSLLLVIGVKRRAVTEWSQRLGIADRVVETGVCTDEELPQYLGCTDVCYLPIPDNLINRARRPHKINDYLAAGKPTVITKVGHVAKIFVENEIGLLAEDSDSDFVDKITLLLRDRDLARDCGKNARDLMVSKFDWSIIGDQLESVLYAALEN